MNEHTKLSAANAVTVYNERKGSSRRTRGAIQLYHEFPLNTNVGHCISVVRVLD